jgi:uncharacterized protein
LSSSTWETRPERPDAPEGRPPERTGEYAWQPWTAPVALIAALMLALVGGLIVSLVGAAFGGDIDDVPPGVLMAATVIQDIGFIGAAIVFARMTGPAYAEHFGLRAAPVGRAIALILGLYFAYGLFAGAWSEIVDLGEPEDQLEDLGVEDSDVALVFAAILVCVVAPVVEEFFFRGFFFAALRNWRGPIVAALLTGAVFGAIHIGSAEVGALVPLAVLGIGLCLLYQWTGSLYPCIALHALNNSLAFGIAVDWDWQIPLLLFGSLLACAMVTVPVARRWRSP